MLGPLVGALSVRINTFDPDHSTFNFMFARAVPFRTTKQIKQYRQKKIDDAVKFNNRYVISAHRIDHQNYDTHGYQIIDKIPSIDVSEFKSQPFNKLHPVEKILTTANDPMHYIFQPFFIDDVIRYFNQKIFCQQVQRVQCRRFVDDYLIPHIDKLTESIAYKQSEGNAYLTDVRHLAQLREITLAIEEYRFPQDQNDLDREDRKNGIYKRKGKAHLPPSHPTVRGNKREQ